ncbi:FtsK/SpoIIIE domain-containing protein [Ectobacillus panaciterrae]|uniref:FtsK/SpoIIIE domain-containing protein n=1 Tax=Ectobacillus panaciterrae TaxID=363872 RepID=UPI0004009231|nr:FtsK/SpoIIIE domain-containing protein [Ectobacillus panaciterrae]
MLAALKSTWKEYQEKQRVKAVIREIEAQTEKAFHTAQLFLEMKTSHDLKTYVYPKILKVDLHESHVEVFGKVPRGMNPKILNDKKFIFQQYLGKNLDIKTDVLDFTIRIFPEKMDEVEYDYKTFPIQDMRMPIIAGKNRFNQWVTFSLINNPNVLIAGIPGSGKSVMCRQILTTLMLHHTSKELELYLCDLKGSEFHIFQECAHVKSMNVTAAEFRPIMKKLRLEIDTRGRLLRSHGVEHIDNLPKSKKKPYILLVIDEILILNDGSGESKELLRELLEYAALGRAAGCYLIVSLQRPCNKSLSTQLRGILNVRCIFKTEDRTNSEIAGVIGAEDISREEPGKMIFKIDTADMHDVQAPFLDVEPAKDLIKPLIQKKKVESAALPQKQELFGWLD